MEKQLVNPFEETVVFGKAYPVAWPPPGATRVRALVPTGRHVAPAPKGHFRGKNSQPDNRLKHVKKSDVLIRGSRRDRGTFGNQNRRGGNILR